MVLNKDNVRRAVYELEELRSKYQDEDIGDGMQAVMFVVVQGCTRHQQKTAKKLSRPVQQGDGQR